MSFRIGHGSDIHRLEAGLPLWLGGVQIPYEKGAVGHSDADALIHAICDALLGAAALGDIGTHFPDTDPAYKGAHSSKFLKIIVQKLIDLGYVICNIDSTITLEKPKLSPYMAEIRNRLAAITGLPVECISVKAKTSEKLGFAGRGEGIHAEAVALIETSPNDI